jgi:A/G-specific adenine glycosylase
MTLAEKKKQFNQILFRWHKRNYREMAWRNTHDPYHILISEIMLQQTQVERVRTKYAEFVKKFPTVQKLARASLGDVLRVWSGLGYNRRAKYLHECAKRVVGEYAGKFPDDIPTLMTLPGIGISTSAALSAFAFLHDEPMIDTNIRRILCRVFFAPKMSRSDLDIEYPTPTDKELYVFAKMLIPTGRGRDWNYAMLDLGATLCTARNHSHECPLEKLHGEVEDFVYKKPQKKFAHSDRYYRGRILATLVVEKSTKAKLGRALTIDAEKLGLLVAKLVSEKLIVMRGQTISIP